MAGVLGSVVVVLVLMGCLVLLVVGLLLWRRNKEKKNSGAGSNIDLSNPNYDSCKNRKSIETLITCSISNVQLCTIQQESVMYLSMSEVLI